jgi:hypothetical protein
MEQCGTAYCVVAVILGSCVAAVGQLVRKAVSSQSESLSPTSGCSPRHEDAARNTPTQPRCRLAGGQLLCAGGTPRVWGPAGKPTTPGGLPRSPTPLRALAGLHANQTRMPSGAGRPRPRHESFWAPNGYAQVDLGGHQGAPPWPWAPGGDLGARQRRECTTGLIDFIVM